MHLLSYVVKCTVTDSPFQHSSKLFEVSSFCLDAFSDSCNQRTCKLMKHCGVVDASCSAENCWSSSFLVFTFRSSASSILNLRTCLAGCNCAAVLILTPIRFVTFCSLTRHVLHAMESTIQETPIYGIVTILMELSKATTNIAFP